jgi:hypothetical protein
MVRKLVGAAVLLVVCVGLTMADEIRAIILKVDGDNVTFAESKGKGERGPERTLPVADNVKVFKVKLNRATKKEEAREPIDKGLKNPIFSGISEKGLRGVIITDESNKKITEIRIGGGGGKKKSN